MSEKVLLERRDSIAHIVLNRPEKLNALDPESIATLEAYAREIEDDRSIRVVVIRGEGRAFCAGGDIGAADQGRESENVVRRSVNWHRAFDAIEALRVPVIAAIHGYALAGGLELVMVCDFAVAAEDAQLGDQHARFALFPGGGATQRLPRLIGERRAKWLLMSGDWLTAAQACDFGLVNEVVPADQLLARADEMARLLASRSPLLNSAIKETVRLGLRSDLPTALAQERPRAVNYMASEDVRIGFEAFANRTTPVFTGR